jgi:hypothetical protein
MLFLQAIGSPIPQILWSYNLIPSSSIKPFHAHELLGSGIWFFKYDHRAGFFPSVMHDSKMKSCPCALRDHAMKAYIPWPHHSWPPHQMEVSVQLHAPATLPQGKRPQCFSSFSHWAVSLPLAHLFLSIIFPPFWNERYIFFSWQVEPRWGLGITVMLLAFKDYGYTHSDIGRTISIRFMSHQVVEYKV